MLKIKTCQKVRYSIYAAYTNICYVSSETSAQVELGPAEVRAFSLGLAEVKKHKINFLELFFLIFND